MFQNSEGKRKEAAIRNCSDINFNLSLRYHFYSVFSYNNSSKYIYILVLEGSNQRVSNSWIPGCKVKMLVSFTRDFFLFQEKCTSFLYCWPGSKSAKIDKLPCYRWDGYFFAGEWACRGWKPPKQVLFECPGTLRERMSVMSVNQMRLCLCCREVVRKKFTQGFMTVFIAMNLLGTSCY